MSAETKTAEKRKQKLLKREKDHLVISHRKLQGYYRFQTRGELELSQPPSTSQRHANPVSAKPDLKQSFHFPNTFLQLPPSQNPVIDFWAPARDLKDSFTVPQPMRKIVAQTPQQKYSPNQNLTS